MSVPDPLAYLYGAADYPQRSPIRSVDQSNAAGYVPNLRDVPPKLKLVRDSPSET
jgi:hypothetical protein